MDIAAPITSLEDNQQLAVAVLEAQKSVLEQSKQIKQLAERIDGQFRKAAEAIFASKGRLIISGMGKSGLIGKKIAATMASTGTSSFFVHPGEAFHGDLGMIRPEDVVMLITNSGETDEVIKLIPSIKSFGNVIIGMTGKSESTLAKHSDVVLNIGVEREVCPNNLAPTSSTTCTLVMGDALAVALMHLRGFKPHDFAVYHPGGSLGRRLLTKVKDVMVKDNLPFVVADECMTDVILKMTNCRLGLAIVMNGEKLLGVITDGDLRRALVGGIDLKQATAKDMMSSAPISINENAKVGEGEEVMRTAHIKQIVVRSDIGKVVGVLEFFQ